MYSFPNTNQRQNANSNSLVTPVSPTTGPSRYHDTRFTRQQAQINELADRFRHGSAVRLAPPSRTVDEWSVTSEIPPALLRAMGEEVQEGSSGTQMALFQKPLQRNSKREEIEQKRCQDTRAPDTWFPGADYRDNRESAQSGPSSRFQFRPSKEQQHCPHSTQ